jgi:hypothetical protein
VLALAAAGTALAQNKVKTETIRPPAVDQQGQAFKADGRVSRPAGAPEIIADTARLPPAVARMRDRILAAARTGDLEKLHAVMKSHAALPVFAFDRDEQRVELFRIVTGADYKDMVEFGAYAFYRVGIAPDGTWHFFVSGD